MPEPKPPKPTQAEVVFRVVTDLADELRAKYPTLTAHESLDVATKIVAAYPKAFEKDK